MILFHIHNTDFKINKRRAIKGWIKRILRDYKKVPGDINIIFCESEYLLKMNNQYLNHNYYTDVISFSYPDPSAERISGDIFIDVQTVRKNAVEYKQSFFTEILRVIIHGILHLTGKEDRTVEQQRDMRAAEDEALDKAGKELVQ